MVHIDAEKVKAAAAGREIELLEYVGHIDRELLGGAHHPCPKCGGKDRFRYTPSKRFAICSQCFNTENGDFLSAIMHFRGISFPQALEECAYRLGLISSLAGNGNGSSGNGNGSRPRRNGTAPQPVPQPVAPARKDDAPGLALDQLKAAEDPYVTRQYAEFWAKHKFGIQAEQALRCIGIQAATWPCRAPQQSQHQVLTVPGFHPDDWTKQKAKLLYRIDGQPFQAFGQLSERKVHLLKGSADALVPVGTVEEFRQAHTAWLCAGLPDAIAISPFLSAGAIACTNTTGEGSFADELVEAFRGKTVNVVMDADEAGEKGQSIRATKLFGVAQSVRVVKLPVEGTPGAKDIRDLVVAGRGKDIIDAAERTEPLTQAPQDGDCQEKEAEPEPWPVEEYDAFQLATLDFPITYLVEEVVVAMQPGIGGGPQKVLKTGVLGCDLAVSMASATHFLNRFRVPNPIRVGVVSSESGMATLAETMRRVALSKDVDLGALRENLFATPESSDFSSTVGIDSLVGWANRRKLQAVIIDPAYLNFCGLAELSANVFKVGEILRGFSRALLAAGITPIVIHHTVKTFLDKYAPLDLTALSGSGWAEYARFWLLLNRRSEYVDGSGFHELHFRLGGSAGHSSLWHLDIDEGPAGTKPRKWRLGLTEAGQAKRDAARARDEQFDMDVQNNAAAIVKHLEKRPGQADTETGIFKLSIGRTKAATQALQLLLDSGRVAYGEDFVCKPGRTSGRKGYRLIQQDADNGSM